jgi:hypothetical protein
MRAGSMRWRDDEVRVGRAPPAVRHLVESLHSAPCESALLPASPARQLQGPATARTCRRQSLRTGERTAGQRPR